MRETTEENKQLFSFLSTRRNHGVIKNIRLTEMDHYNMLTNLDEIHLLLLDGLDYCESSSNESDGGDAIRQRSKRKRRQWPVKEKLAVLNTFKLNRNKRQTSVQHGCTTAQVRKWLETEVKLINFSKKEKGKLL